MLITFEIETATTNKIRIFQFQTWIVTHLLLPLSNLCCLINCSLSYPFNNTHVLCYFFVWSHGWKHSSILINISLSMQLYWMFIYVYTIHSRRHHFVLKSKSFVAFYNSNTGLWFCSLNAVPHFSTSSTHSFVTRIRMVTIVNSIRSNCGCLCLSGKTLQIINIII